MILYSVPSQGWNNFQIIYVDEITGTFSSTMTSVITMSFIWIIGHISSFELASTLKGVNFMSQSSNSIEIIYKIHYMCCSWIGRSWFFLKKKGDSSVVSKIYCALSAFTHFNFAWCWGCIIKQIFLAIFYLISKLFTIGTIKFLSASRRWILLTSSE